VFLVGAGPGDPGLITVRGWDVLRQATVVIYDALVDRALLDVAPAGAELIDAGKRAKAHKLSQDEINRLILEKALEGNTVVRLKGGDPYLFGRGAEEIIYLAAYGVDCEMIPGVTAGIAAPAAAGIPVTHRDYASTLTLVTGHEDPTKVESSVDYRSLAGLILAGGTVCFYMGVGRLAEIVGELQKNGASRETPMAVVQWGTTPRQRSVRTTVGFGPRDVEAAGVGSPAIIVVGRVAGIQEPGLDFASRRLLFGQRVVITRTRHQASDLRQGLDRLGALTLEAPTIELVPPREGWAAVDEQIKRIGEYDWLILTSANGVTALAERLSLLGLDARCLGSGVRGGVKVAAIGDATAEASQSRLCVRPDLVPTKFVAESLAAELIAGYGGSMGMSGKRCLLLRADIARPALPRMLREAGAEVAEFSVYETRRVSCLPEGVWLALRAGEVDWMTFTSSSTAENMVAILGEERELLTRVKLASIGPITSETMKSLGLKVDVEAKTSNISGLVEAICRACGG
jgi:uroporphyrinogen III methyltransferase/synthase